MKLKILMYAAILAIPICPLSSQEVSPLIVKTLKPTPTVVKTYEPFTVTYRIEFLDLSRWGKEIVLDEEQLKPDRLDFAPFEATSYKVKKDRIGETYTYDFTYTLRIINPKKGEYKVPKLKIFWILKNIGEDESQSKIRKLETEEVVINYFSTITKDPELDVRDNINFGNFKSLIYATRIVGTLILLTAVFLGISLIRPIKMRFVSRKAKKLVPKKDEEEGKTTTAPALGEARRNFYAGIKKLGSVSLVGEALKEKQLRIERELLQLVRTLVLGEVLELSLAHTPSEIYSYIENNVTDAERKFLLLSLAFKLKSYEEDLELGEPRVLKEGTKAELEIELKKLKNLADNLAWDKLLSKKFRQFFSRIFRPKVLRGRNR